MLDQLSLVSNSIPTFSWSSACKRTPATYLQIDLFGKKSKSASLA